MSPDVVEKGVGACNAGLVARNPITKKNTAMIRQSVMIGDGSQGYTQMNTGMNESITNITQLQTTSLSSMDQSPRPHSQPKLVAFQILPLPRYVICCGNMHNGLVKLTPFETSSSTYFVEMILVGATPSSTHLIIASKALWSVSHARGGVEELESAAPKALAPIPPLDDGAATGQRQTEEIKEKRHRTCSAPYRVRGRNSSSHRCRGRSSSSCIARPGGNNATAKTKEL